MGWVSWPQYIFVFLASFSTLWWPNIWLKMGFPEFKKQNYWFHSLHTWHLPLGVSLLTPIHFRVPSLICDPLVAKCLTKMGFLELFEKNFWLNSFHTWHLPLWGESFDTYHISRVNIVKHQSSASLPFVRGIHRGPVNSSHKWPVTRTMFPFDDVIMFVTPLQTGM